MLQKTSSKKDVISPKDSISIGDHYLKPTLERLTNEEADQTTPLDLLLGSTIGTYNPINFIHDHDTHYSNSQIFVQKFNFDITQTFSRVFHPNFFDNFSREIKVVNS